MASENMKMVMFDDRAGTLSCNIQSRVNEFLSRTDIEVCDIKMSNSDQSCVICIFYKLKDILYAKWIKKPRGDAVCSNCGKSALISHEEYHRRLRIEPIETPFCPHCGAKMDGIIAE